METSLSPLHCRNGAKDIRQISGERATVEDILDFLPELNSHGFRCYGRSAITDTKHRELRAALRNPDTIGGLSRRNMEQVAGWLSSFEHGSRWKHSSYSLKHTFERETGTYMGNGAFIVAVIMAGFEIKIDSPNALLKLRRPAL